MKQADLFYKEEGIKANTVERLVTLQSIIAFFTGTNLYSIFYIVNENLAVSDMPV
jgi:hypothetical protein